MSLYGHHEPFDFSVVVPGGGHVYFTTFAAAERKEMGSSEAQELQTWKCREVALSLCYGLVAPDALGWLQPAFRPLT